MSSVPLVNAYYFFNRVEGDDVKYVLYHCWLTDTVFTLPTSGLRPKPGWTK